MVRMQRVHYEAAIYHVIVRGNNRERIFAGAEEKGKYLQIIQDYCERYKFHFLGYVIMDNHAHLLIKVERVELAKIMQGIQQRYTQYYNRRYARTGHVFEQRYKAKLCSDEKYLLTLLCYVHQNPLKAGLPEGIEYEWSSHNNYMGKVYSGVETEFILSMISNRRIKAIAEYQRLMGREVETPEYGELPNEQQRTNRREMILLEHSDKPSWDDLIEAIAADMKVEKERVISKSRNRKIAVARKKLIYEAIEKGGLKQVEIAKRLQMDQSVVSRFYSEFIKSKSYM